MAPQVSGNPLQYQLAISDSVSVRAACDQMNSVGLLQLLGQGEDYLLISLIAVGVSTHCC